MKVNPDLLLVLTSPGLGEGEPDLGEKLLKSFLSVLLDSGQLPSRIICMKTAVFLTTENSPVAELLRQYEQAGTEILSCTTCLEYYGRADKLVVGKPTNMRETVSALLRFPKIISF